MRTLIKILLPLALAGCISDPEPRVHRIDCGTLDLRNEYDDPKPDTLVVRDGKCGAVERD